MPDYNPVPVPQVNQDYVQQNQQMQNYAQRPTSAFQGDINKNLEQSNLMGPSQDQSPEDQALSARANQMYNSQMSQLTRNSAQPAMQRQLGWEGHQIDNNAALYSNMQSRMSLQYQQAQFARQSALVQAGMQYQAMNSLFQGVGFGGAWAAKGLYNAANKSPTEPTGNISVSNYAGNDSQSSNAIQPGEDQMLTG